MFQVSYLSTILVLIGGIAAAQTHIDLRTQSKGVDFQTAPYTKPVRSGTALPATCARSELFLLMTAAPANAKLYACADTDTWVTGTGAAAITVQNDGTTVGAEATQNFTPGLGMVNVVTDVGTRINVQQGVDTAVVLSKATQQTGGTLFCPSTSGSGTTYTCALNPTLTSYTAGMVLHWQPDAAAAGGGTTLNVDLLGPVSVKEADGVTDPKITDILPGRLYWIWYDGTVFRLPAGVSGGGGLSLSGAPNLVLATDPGGSFTDVPALRSLTAADLPATSRTRGFQVIFSGSDVAAGAVVYVTMPYGCTAKSYALSADPAGTATIKLWKTADGTALPLATNSISSTGFSLSSGGIVHSSNLSDLGTLSWAPFDTTAVVLAAVGGNPSHVNFTLECGQ